MNSKKLKSASAAAGLAVIDELINTVPDVNLRTLLKTLAFAVKVPYAFLKELLPDETDSFVREVLTSKEITQEVIRSPEFQQALGSTIESMVYAKEKQKRDVIKKVFSEAYISQDEYAKDHMERLQNVAQRISIPALQHIVFFKRDILFRRDAEIDELVKQRSLPPGFTLEEQKEFLKRTKAVSEYYNSWHQEQKKQAEKNFKRIRSDETRRIYDLSSADEQKRRNRFSEFWSEFNSLGIFKQGNDPTIGTVGGGSGTVQYLTEFGERFISYVKTIAKLE